jgi:hypothetical protein
MPTPAVSREPLPGQARCLPVHPVSDALGRASVARLELTVRAPCPSQNTTRSLLDYSGNAQGAAVGSAAEPEFHSSLDMGKVRLNVSAPSGVNIVVPCDHRQTVADVTAKIQERVGKAIVALTVGARSSLTPANASSSRICCLVASLA